MNRKLLILTVWAVSMLGAGCGGGSSPSKSNPTMASSGQNVVAISVNGGPTNNYVNGVFVTLTVCVPGSSSCQSIPNVLVDTGSSGLRLLSSALTISLKQQNGPGGHPVAECVPFLSGFTWGPVETADIQIAGERASTVPIQVLSDTAFPVPSGCSSTGLQSMDSLSTLGANGLLGVGLFAQDCGPACASPVGNPGLYYECPSSGCQPITEAMTQQVQNPVAMFPSDNNGVMIELPAVSSGQPSITGSLVFGIGTQSNNALNGATVYAVNSSGNFTTTFKGKSYPGSFVDSGSNGYFFLNSNTTSITACGSPNGFYCPSNTQNLSAENEGTNGNSGTVNFSVANADTLFSTNTNFVFGDLGGPGQSDFDWGLPFFYGRNVFTAIEGKSTPAGIGPYWAY